MIQIFTNSHSYTYQILSSITRATPPGVGDVVGGEGGCGGGGMARTGVGGAGFGVDGDCCRWKGNSLRPPTI